MRRLTLTFDNGPTPGITEIALDTLARFGLRSTFFLVAENLESPEACALAARTRREGHRIGNHTLRHGRPLGERSAEEAAEEILGAHALISPFIENEIYFRPNGAGRTGSHLLNETAVELLAGLDATIVTWNSVPKDRLVNVPAPDSWVTQAKRDVLAQYWTLMVLHDRPSGHAEQPLTHLAGFIEWALGEGVEFTQDFPPECTPMVRGVALPELSACVTYPGQ
jgi:peptidoglycan-N-acetylglucosamine deacetylase